MIRIFLFLSLLLFSSSIFAQEIEIWEIQGASNISPYINAQVTTLENVVTAVGSDRFFIQCPTDRSDNDPLTSDGIMVYTGNDNPILEVGDIVNVTGIIIEYEELTEFSNQGLTFEKIGTANLPPPIILNNTFPSTIAQSVAELERVEGMRVQFENGVTTAPTAFDGSTYVTLSGNRSFREAGIRFPGEQGLPVWDGNPETFEMDVERLTNDQPNWYSGTTVSGTGVMSYSNGTFVFYPTTYSHQPNVIEQAVRPKAEDEVSIGCINVYVLDSDDFDYQVRLTKLAKYVVEGMQAPDIIAFQEVERKVVLEDLIERIEELFPQQTNYTAYLFGGSSGGFSIELGYLVDDLLDDVTVTQLGVDEEMSTGSTLHNRPPLLLEANFPTVPPTPISVLNLHLRSLNGIVGSNQSDVRLRRQEAAVSVAQMIQERQEDNLIIVGDYNAFDFSDGYVDVFNQISGFPSEGAEYQLFDLVDPPLIYHNELLPEDQQYSYVFRGNAQTLDHCLSTTLQNIEATDMAYVRGNADHPEGSTNNSSAFGISDHDGFVLYLRTAIPIGISTPVVLSDFSYPNPFEAGDIISFKLENAQEVFLRWYSTDGRLLYSEDLGLLPSGEQQISSSFAPKEGMYLMRVSGEGIERSGFVYIGQSE